MPTFLPTKLIAIDVPDHCTEMDPWELMQEAVESVHGSLFVPRFVDLAPELLERAARCARLVLADDLNEVLQAAARTLRGESDAD